MDKLKIIPEKLSAISLISQDADKYILTDLLRRKAFYLNKVAYSICTKINGNNTLEDIGRQISEEYKIPPEEAIKDVVEFYNFLKKEKLILIKNGFYYRYIKFYYRLLRIPNAEV